MIKIVVPVFLDAQFLGAVGGCGLLLGEDGEIETFLLGKTLDMEECDLEELAKRIGSLSERQAEEICALISNQLEKIVSKSL